MKRFYFIFLISTLSVVSSNIYSITYGYTHQSEIKLQPSLPITFPLHIDEPVVRKMVNYYACYSAYDGKPINCTFNHTVHGLKEPFTDVENNAGHDGFEHDFSGRDFVYENKHLKFNGYDESPLPLTVSGETIISVFTPFAEVIHELPFASGKIVEEVFVNSPYGWSCAINCFSFNSSRYLTTYDIGVHGLKKLEPENESSSYKRVRTRPDLYHSFEEAYYGLPTTVETLKLIADNYFLLSERKLSVNDMSLRKGGLFDVRGNWKPGHKSHREGKDVDINVRNEVNCKDDRDFFVAVDMLLPPVAKEEFNPFSGVRSAVNCESLGGEGGIRKHIDFEIGFDKYIGTGSFY